MNAQPQREPGGLAEIIPLNRDPKLPHLTERGRAKYLDREREACGPQQLAARMRAVNDASRAREIKVLAGSLEDLAAAAIVWAHRLREQHGFWPR